MKNRRRNTNLKLLELAMKDVALEEKPAFRLSVAQDKHNLKLSTPVSETIVNEVKPIVKIPKGKGVKKDALINTKKLLTI